MSGLRERYLEAIGIPVWRRREPRDASVEAGGGGAAALTGEAAGGGAAARPGEAADRVHEHAGGGADTFAGAAASAAPAREAASPGPTSERPDVAQLDWDALARIVSACTLCPLHASRTQTVFGVGNRQADLLVVGEAPGADEDRQGEPFVGRAGRLLNAMLRAIGFERGDVYIANVLKCRPPNNRDPQPLEAAACTPYLERQMALLAPKVILAVGRVSSQWLLQSDRPIGTLRGRVYRYGTHEVPLIVTYHPAYLLRSPEAKAKAWADLCMVKSILEERE